MKALRRNAKASPSRTAKRPESEALPPAGPGWPSWLAREELERLTPEQRREALELIVPVHRELVIEAASALEKVAGKQLVFLCWLELLRTYRLSGELTKGDPMVRLPGEINVEREIDRYLQLGAQKVKVARFLLRMKELRERRATAAAVSLVAARPLSNGIGRHDVSVAEASSATSVHQSQRIAVGTAHPTSVGTVAEVARLRARAQESNSGEFGYCGEFGYADGTRSVPATLAIAEKWSSVDQNPAGTKDDDQRRNGKTEFC